MRAPDKIYLQWHGDNPVVDLADLDAEPDTPDISSEDGTWHTERIYDIDVEYVRADVVTALREKLRAAVADLVHAVVEATAEDNRQPELGTAVAARKRVDDLLAEPAR